ncbi:MAG: cell division protein FtsQ/DivIB [Thermodesulfobacteriota bacterium]
MTEAYFRSKKGREWKGERKILTILKRTLRITLALLLFSFSLFIGHRLYAHVLGDPLFRVREVEIEGCQRIPKEVLLSLITIEGMPNLFTLRLREVARRLESHPWIDQVKVRKVFPDRIVVEVVERRPIAILQLEELYYIDDKGVIFSPVGDSDRYNFPFLTGLNRETLEKNPEEANRLIMKALELLSIAEKERGTPLEEISEIHMEKTFGVHCFTQGEGLEVKMGWENFGEKLKKLSLIWSDLKKRGWVATSIDCSDARRIVVKRVIKGEEKKGVTKR